MRYEEMKEGNKKWKAGDSKDNELAKRRRGDERRMKRRRKAIKNGRLEISMTRNELVKR